jgi:hypothetical protein
MHFTLLRLFVAAALLANLAYAAWQAGALRGLGLAPMTQRDPNRIEQQVRPNALRVLTPPAAASAAAAAASAAAVGPGPPALTGAASAPAGAAPAPATAAPGGSAQPGAASVAGAEGALACLDIGPLEAGAAIDGAERALAAVLPTRAWVREQRPAPARYAVFVGPIMSRDAARLRREELVRLKMSFETIELPDGKAGGKQGGYSLGRHDSEAAAQAALDELRARGLRNARVVPTGEAGAARTWLRMERLTAAQTGAVRALPAAAFGGQTAGECSLGSVMSVGAPR